uniref:Large ribosomal subunit protein uL5c n=1 Tax=Porphyridium purpureum TaxID=35688 RepID=W0RYZ4_PORPP|nr:chloroplast 50S ribosomal protein L5 [Porphyridium purpureum]ATJ02890.1 50S ribosomal protein L5 [Porphyridium purpureum]BAO23667.1 chloroplast 50S ribosomal protein L5 [Porphyridium purpureum]
MTSGIKLLYETKVFDHLKTKFNYSNVHQVPKITKITINRGLGEASQNAKILDLSLKEMSIITGQKPIVTKAKKAVAGFKIREEMPIGMKVTLRREKMYSFLERLINLALPRIRDFRGISPKQFDGRGNFNIGFKEQLMFPEIAYNDVDKILGINISISTTAKTDEECLALLSELGMPFTEK